MLQRFFHASSLLSRTCRVATPPPLLRQQPINQSHRRLTLAAAAAGLSAATAAAAAVAAATTPMASCESAPRSRGRVLCLHGVNLNMFGKRDPATYGTATLSDIDNQLRQLASQLGVDVECYQTNHEGELVERIHRAHIDDECDVVLINAGAWTHYSYGLRDALAILTVPVIEVHMSNIHAREDMAGSQGEQMRHHSVVSPLAKGIVAGFGLQSYLLGLRAASELIGATRAPAAAPAAAPAPAATAPEPSAAPPAKTLTKHDSKVRSPFGNLG